MPLTESATNPRNRLSDSNPAGGPSRLPPPGPLARRRRRPVRKRLQGGLRSAGAPALAIVTQRRRPIAIAVLSLAGAYALVALSTGSEPSSSQSPAPLGGPPLPLEVAGTKGAAPATAAQPRASSAEVLGARRISAAGGRFELSLPSDWRRAGAGGDAAVFRGPSGEAEVTVLVEPSTGAGLPELAAAAAAYLAARGPRGAEIERIPARPEGDLFKVARARGGDETRTAYVARAGGDQYLVVSSRDDDASGRTRERIEALVRKLELSR